MARAPKLRQAASAAKKAGYAYVVLDGTLIPAGRVAADRPFYSGKHKKHGMNLQVIASPAGDIVWVSGALPGAVHDKRAKWIWGVLADLEAAGLVTLADKGYQGSSYAKIPYRGKNKPQSQKEANRAHARLRSPGERANAQLKGWRILRKLRCCPWRAGQPPGFSFIGDYGREFLRILLTWGFAACAGMMVLSGVHPAGAGRRKAGPEQRAGVGLCLVPACGRRRAPWFWEITGYHTMQSPDLERSSPCRICRGITG